LTSSQRLLLLLIVIVAGAALGGAVLWTGSDDGVSPRELSGPTPGAHGKPRDVNSKPALLDSGAGLTRLSADGDPVGRLELKVIDTDGQRLDATVQLTGEAGTIDVVGSQTWKDFPPGTWTINVSSEGLLPHRETFEVPADETTRLTIRLSEVLRIEGRLVDRFGGPWEATPIWFLRTKRSHPVDRQAARKLIATSSSANGSFSMELRRNGEYRLSVGQPGKALATMDGLMELIAGGPTEVEIVMTGGTRLKIELEAPPNAVIEGRSTMTVAVMMESKDRAKKGPRRRMVVPSGSGAQPRGDRKHRRSNVQKGKDLREEVDRERQGGEAAAPPEAEDFVEPIIPDFEVTEDGKPVPAEKNEPRWTERASGRLGLDGRLVWNNLPANRDLRLVLRRRGDSFESQVLRLATDRETMIRFRTPQKRTKEEIAADPVGELTAFVQQSGLPEDARAAGFHWR
jgi:hypothetical protein